VTPTRVDQSVVPRPSGRKAPAGRAAENRFAGQTIALDTPGEAGLTSLASGSLRAPKPGLTSLASGSLRAPKRLLGPSESARITNESAGGPDRPTQRSAGGRTFAISAVCEFTPSLWKIERR
jgi:hypothetical protein